MLDTCVQKMNTHYFVPLILKQTCNKLGAFQLEFFYVTFIKYTYTLLYKFICMADLCIYGFVFSLMIKHLGYGVLPNLMGLLSLMQACILFNQPQMSWI